MRILVVEHHDVVITDPAMYLAKAAGRDRVVVAT